MNSNRNLISPEINGEDENNISLRPKMLNDFGGQKKVKQNLDIFIKSAKKRGETLDHILFYGPPGLGKTTLAQICANEMGVNFKSTAGPMLTKSGDLAAILTNLQENDVIFIDEIHRLSTNIEEVLYPAMEDFCLDIIIGEGPSAKTIKIDLPKFTLIGATTRLGLLTNPLRDRFGIPLKLEYYSVEELQKLLQRAASVINAGIDDDGSKEIAMRARGTPRIAIRLLKRVWDFTLVAGEPIITKKLADNALNLLEVDSYGLDMSDRKYLEFIANNYNGGPVGIETLAAALSEQRDSIEETIEPFLIQNGFVQRTPRGRVLTIKAFDHLGINPSKSKEDNNDNDLFAAY